MTDLDPRHTVGREGEGCVSVIIVAYNTGPRLVECVESARRQRAVDVEIIVVNNGDPAPELDQVAELGGVRLIDAGGNLGFPGGCNLGARHARGNMLFFLNPDAAFVDDHCLARVTAVAAEPGVGIAMAIVVLRNDPAVVNSSGGVVHVTGLGWAGGFGSPASALPDRRSVPNASGAAMAVPAAVFDELGGFCEEYFLYHEDIELSWRAHLLGYDVVAVNGAFVSHDYDFARNERKLGMIERNRLVLVATCFSARLVGLLLPVLAAYELAITLHAWREGWLRAKAAGWSWLWRNRRWLIERRRELQATRTVEDRRLTPFLSGHLDPGMVDLPGAARLADAVVARYWSLAERLV